MPAGEFTFQSLLCVHLVCTLHLCLSSVGQIKTFFVEVVSADRKGGVGSALPRRMYLIMRGKGGREGGRGGREGGEGGEEGGEGG